MSCDVADRGSLEKLLQASVQAFGKVDILVNAAGFNQRAPTLDFSDADWDRLIDTNLTGTLRACQVFGRHMIERSMGASSTLLRWARSWRFMKLRRTVRARRAWLL